MPAPHAAALTRFFTQVAKKDPVRLESLNIDGFCIDATRWSFRLSELYAYLIKQQDLTDIEYKQFRQLLFSSPINETISNYGARITIIDNRGKADQSIYAMEWSA